MEIHAIAKDQYPRYRRPNGAEAFVKGRILGRYQSGMGQKKGTARAKLGQSCFQCKRVASPWSRTSGVVAARGRGFVSSYQWSQETHGIWGGWGSQELGGPSEARRLKEPCLARGRAKETAASE